jgi:PAS domain S-box-containing protein
LPATLAGYGLALVAVGLVTAPLLAIQHRLIAGTGQYVRPYGIAFLLPIALVSLIWGARQGGFTLLLCLLSLVYFLMPPRYSFILSHARDAGELVALALAGGVVILCLEAVRASRERTRTLLLQVQETREQLQALVEGVRDYALFLLDGEGRVTSWNPGVGRLLGYREDEIVGKHFSVLFTPEDIAGGAPEEELTIARREGKAGDDRWHVRRDGSRFWATGVVHPLRDGAGALRGFTKVMGDITRYKEVEEALAAAYEKEHRIAESLQRSFLLMPPEEKFPGLELATLYEAAWDEASVGGDFFDVFALDENRRVALVVGDASGKGLAAATRTAEVKYALRAFLREYADTGRCVSRLNAHLCDSLRLDWQGGFAFTALCLAVVDQACGDVSLSIAGSESPMIARADGTVEVVEIKFNGLPLGVDETQEYATATFRLEAGDTLLLFTDGIIEARRARSRDFFGYEGLIPLAGNAARGALRPTGRAIVEAARAFSGGTLQDDVCLLLARRKSGEESSPAAGP